MPSGDVSAASARVSRGGAVHGAHLLARGIIPDSSRGLTRAFRRIAVTSSFSLRRRLLAAAAIVAAVVVGGCKVDSINYFPPHPAQVRVLNLIPDAPAVDMTVDGNPAFSNVAYESVSGYQNYDNRQTTFTVTLSGTSVQLASFRYPLAGDQPYTVVLYGSLASPQLTIVAEVGNSPTNGNIQLSIFNAAQNTSSVDVYVTAPGTDIATVGPNFGNVSFGGTTNNIQFRPGSYQIQVTPQGTKNVLYDSGGNAPLPNVALSFIVYSRGSGTLVNAMVLQALGPMVRLDSIFARAKAVNGAPTVGPVNQLISTLGVNYNVNFASASAYTVIPAGPTTVNFAPSAAPGAILASTPFTVPAATDISTFVAGPVGAEQAFALVDVNVPPYAGNVRLRFVNASWNSNPVNASVNGTQMATGVGYGTASAYGQIGATTATVTFTDAVTGAVLASESNVVLTANQTSTIYLLGPAGAQAVLVTQDN